MPNSIAAQAIFASAMLPFCVGVSPASDTNVCSHVDRTESIPTPALGLVVMIFSTRAEYGVRLMVELGRQHTDGPTPLNVIAENEGLPLPYLEHVVAKLKKADLVISTRGAHGGY